MLGNEEFRYCLHVGLIEAYFAPELHSALLEQGVINAEAFRYSQELVEHALTHKIKEGLMEEERYRPAARDQGFRRAVVTAYDHRCALCGIRVLTPDGHSIVEAKHIKPWSISHNDDLRNGMSLCRLCHWTFDEGLISISSQYVVIASRQLAINQNILGHLVTMVGRVIIGPTEESLWPDLEALDWHYRNIFQKPRLNSL